MVELEQRLQVSAPDCFYEDDALDPFFLTNRSFDSLLFTWNNRQYSPPRSVSGVCVCMRMSDACVTAMKQEERVCVLGSILHVT